MRKGFLGPSSSSTGTSYTLKAPQTKSALVVPNEPSSIGTQTAIGMCGSMS